MMSSDRRPSPVVAVLNMKGGVGKTTVTAAIFREMHRTKRRRVLLVDFDPQYNLTQLLVGVAASLRGTDAWHLPDASGRR